MERYCRIAKYAIKMLRAPKGTTFEWYGKPVSKLRYTFETTRILVKGRP